MISTSITVPNRAGLHARAAAKFVATAAPFQSRIELSNGEKTVDGKSILSLMLLAAPQGSELKLQLDGADEQDALRAILALLEARFGED
jgi:phosphocarrier protein